MRYNILKALCVCGGVVAGMSAASSFGESPHHPKVDPVPELQDFANPLTRALPSRSEIIKGTELHVSEANRDAFFKLTPEQTKDIKSVYVEGQEIDDEFDRQWFKLFSKNDFTKVSFEQCTFGASGPSIFHGVDIADLIVARCNLTSRDARQILYGVNQYVINEIDFSYNKMGEDEEFFNEDVLDHVVSSTAIDTLILTGNKFSRSFYRMTEKYDAYRNLCILF